jgi:hypothetical protein
MWIPAVLVIGVSFAARVARVVLRVVLVLVVVVRVLLVVRVVLPACVLPPACVANSGDPPESGRFRADSHSSDEDLLS